MTILTHEEAKSLSYSSENILDVIRNTENAVVAKLAAGVTVEPVAWRVWIGDMTAQEYIYSEIGDGEPLYTATAIAAARVQTAAEPVSKFRLLTITTAYEQGVGKGIKRDKFNPYAEGTDERDAWELGYREGIGKPAAQTAAEPVAWGWPDRNGRIVDCIATETHAKYEGEYTVPLYTSPPTHTAEMRLALDALNVAFSYDGDVFGIRHNDAVDAIAALQKALGDKT
jgi:hypothetical protein